MKKIIFIFQSIIITFILIVIFSFINKQDDNNININEVLNEYWEADTKIKKKKAAKKIISQSITFDEIFLKLKQGKKYSNEVSKGLIDWNYTIDSIEYYSLVFIPYNYNPQKKYRVHIQLHGAVSGLFRSSIIDKYIKYNVKRFENEEDIIVYPAGWIIAPWWNKKQYKNIQYLINRLKENYNINENAIHLGGVSDGGTGIFYIANCNQTPWASFSSYIGNLKGLSTLSDKQIYFTNFKGKPYFIANGSEDHVFPLEIILPYIQIMEHFQIDLQFHLTNSGHDNKWYEILKDSISTFFNLHKRNPYPDKIFWRTDRTNQYAKNHWVIINQLGNIKCDNEFISLKSDLQKHASDFLHKIPSGQIKAEQEGNTIKVETCGINTYSLLLSPEAFDFDKPLKVYTNNILSFDGKIEKSIKTLFKWNIIDNDRTMLFAHELKIKVGKKYKTK